MNNVFVCRFNFLFQIVEKIKIYFILFLISFSSFCYSQNTRNDSIKRYFTQIEILVSKIGKEKKTVVSKELLLNKRTHSIGKEKVNVLLDLYTFYKYKNIDTARKYNNEALRISKEIAYQKGVLQANYNDAFLCFVNADFDKSTNLLKSIDLSKNEEYSINEKADFTCLMSLNYTEKGEYDKALDVSLKLLDLGEKENNDYVLMKAHGALLHYYLRTENYSKALNHCLKGLEYTIKLEEVQYLYFKIDEIARLLFNLGDAEKALEVYDFYLKLESKMNPPGDYFQSIVYMNMADIYTSNNLYKEAQSYIEKALDLNYKNGFRFRIPRAQILQAKLYLKEQDTLKAIDFYEKSLNAAEEINAFDVVQSTSDILSGLYEKIGEPSKAFQYEALHHSIKDSLFSNEKEQKIVILEATRKIKEITQQQKILTLKNEAQKNKIRTIVSVLLGILFLGVIVLFSYLKVKNKNKLLYNRTIELATIQLEMRNKIEDLERIKANEGSKKQEEDNKIIEKTEITHSSNTLDESVKTIILNKLNNLEKERFFINQDCSLRSLAEQLKTNPKYLSQVINQTKKSNFNNYINELRINFLLTRLLEDNDFRESKLSYIAVSVGFNNLNTFNSAFKKRQGILPSYFIKQLIHSSKRV